MRSPDTGYIGGSYCVICTPAQVAGWVWGASSCIPTTSPSETRQYITHRITQLGLGDDDDNDDRDRNIVAVWSVLSCQRARRAGASRCQACQVTLGSRAHGPKKGFAIRSHRHHPCYFTWIQLVPLASAFFRTPAPRAPVPVSAPALRPSYGY